MIEVTTAALAAHPFFRGTRPGQLEALGTVASDVTFEPGQRIFDVGGYAGRFWLIQSGHIVLDLHVQGEAVTVGTLGIGDLLDWSWLFPPFTRTLGAVALSPAGAFEFDAAAVGRAARPTPR